MTLPSSIRKWGEILLPILAFGGVGGAGLEFYGLERFIDNAAYVDQVSIEFLEFELRYNEQIGALKERIARLEGTHEAAH